MRSSRVSRGLGARLRLDDGAGRHVDEPRALGAPQPPVRRDAGDELDRAEGLGPQVLLEAPRAPRGRRRRPAARSGRPASPPRRRRPAAAGSGRPCRQVGERSVAAQRVQSRSCPCAGRSATPATRGRKRSRAAPARCAASTKARRAFERDPAQVRLDQHGVGREGRSPRRGRRRSAGAARRCGAGGTASARPA